MTKGAQRAAGNVQLLILSLSCLAGCCSTVTSSSSNIQKTDWLCRVVRFELIKVAPADAIDHQLCASTDLVIEPASVTLHNEAMEIPAATAFVNFGD